MSREDIVYDYLQSKGIAFSHYNHPEGKTIEEAKRWWHDDGSVHCKNIFLRNHKGNQHYLVCFDCDHDLDIHDLEQRLKAELMAQDWYFVLHWREEDTPVMTATEPIIQPVAQVAAPTQHSFDETQTCPF